KAMELVALILLGTDAAGVERAARWELRLRDRLWVTISHPEYEVGNLFRTLDWRLAATVARFTRWTAEHGLADAFVALAGALALAHLEPADRHTAGVGSLARAVQDAGLQEPLHSLRHGGHVGALAHHEHAAVQEVHGVLFADLVLRGAGERALGGDGPHRVLAV